MHTSCEKVSLRINVTVSKANWTNWWNKGYVMGQNDHSMDTRDKDKNSDESTITEQVVRFTELMSDSDVEEVD